MTPEARRLRAAKIVGTIIGGPEYLANDIDYIDEELKRAMAEAREWCAKRVEEMSTSFVCPDQFNRDMVKGAITFQAEAAAAIRKEAL